VECPLYGEARLAFHLNVFLSNIVDRHSVLNVLAFLNAVGLAGQFNGCGFVLL
jgi:hypothetical protein